ncbi:hypothetical protein NIES2104_14370 [Leptolyngbya sp. NIES-2104]|nr:hypothetical protein NIES2104_14370 [Leptolyngbya sp. NIES-2104]
MDLFGRVKQSLGVVENSGCTIVFLSYIDTMLLMNEDHERDDR